MGQAKHYIEIIEGFKLGDLGAGSTKFVNRSTPQVPPEPKVQKTKTQNKLNYYSFKGNVITWSQDIDSNELASSFRLSNEEQNKTAYIHCTLFIRQAAKGGTPEYYPVLSVEIFSIDGEVVSRTIRFANDEVKFVWKDQSYPWLKQIAKVVKREGLLGLAFPKAWRKI